MKIGSTMSLVDKVVTSDGGIKGTYSLQPGSAVRVLVLEAVLPAERDKPFDLDVAMSILGWVRKDLAVG